MRTVSFTLPYATTGLNVRDRTHWAKRRAQKAKMALEILALLGGPAHFPRPPFAKARLTIVRHSAGTLDLDNLYAAAKGIADILCVKSKRHPFSLSVMLDDAPAYCDLVVSQAPAKRRHAFTTVHVEEIE